MIFSLVFYSSDEILQECITPYYFIHQHIQSFASIVRQHDPIVKRESSQNQVVVHKSIIICDSTISIIDLIVFVFESGFYNSQPARVYGD